MTCIGPNGVAAQLQALQNLLRWSHPKVTVSEFPDIDDGTPVYEDDAITVFTITKPSTPWNKPQFTSSRGPVLDTAGTSANGTAAGSTPTSSTSQSSSEDTSESEGSQVDDGEENEGKDVRAVAGGSVEALSDSEEESSSDSEDDSQGACPQTLQQQQQFRRMDAVFSSGGLEKDVVSNIRSCIFGNRAQPSIPQHRPAATQHSTAREQPGGKRGLFDEYEALGRTPRRVRSRAGAAQSNHIVETFSNSDKAGVVVARYATGSIAKQSSGAYGFLVQIKGSDRFLLLSFASDVRNTHFCSASALLKFCVAVLLALISLSAHDLAALTRVVCRCLLMTHLDRAKLLCHTGGTAAAPGKASHDPTAEWHGPAVIQARRGCGWDRETEACMLAHVST